MQKNFLIFGPNHIGDVLMLTPAIRALKLKFPDGNILVVVSSKASPVLYRNPDIFKVIERKKTKGIAEFFELYKELKQYDFYACIDFSTSFKFAVLTVFLSKIRVGIRTFKTSIFFNHKVYNDRTLHNIDKAIKFTDPFFIKEVYHPRQLIYDVTDGDIENAKILLKAYGLNFNEETKIVIFAPCSTRSSKEANPELFSLFADYLNKINFYVLITGTKKDEVMCNKIYSAIKDKNRAFNIAGFSDLYTLGGLIKLSKFTVCVDNGTMHLSTAIRTPTVALFGSTDPKICGPVSDKSYVIDKTKECSHCFLNSCPKDSYKDIGYPECMKFIEVDDLIRGMNAVLQ
jgi:heptosyltransferase-2